MQAYASIRRVQGGWIVESGITESVYTSFQKAIAAVKAVVESPKGEVESVEAES